MSQFLEFLFYHSPPPEKDGVDSQRGQELITLGSYGYNNISFRSSKKAENQMKSGLLC